MSRPMWFRRSPRSSTVTAPDGRVWALRRNMIWRSPLVAATYEHDARSGGAPVTGTFLILFWCAVGYLSLRAHIPWYLWLLAAVLITCLAVTFYVSRPWQITVECANPVERWEGIMVGRGKAREEMRLITRAIRSYNSPAHLDAAVAQTVAPLGPTSRAPDAEGHR